MRTVGIVCEYNPLHLGHQKQMRQIRRDFGPETAIVCAISGNFVQRGHPAIFDKSLRAKAALVCGADLVVELPVTRCLSSAEGFAQGGVEVLAKVCDSLCFGTESQNPQQIVATAQALLDPDFPLRLRRYLDAGKSFPAARQAALEEMGLPGLTLPNDILAVEYAKAVLASGLSLQLHPIVRQGSYHDQTPDRENPSATSLRRLILAQGPWQDYVPPEAWEIFRSAPIHTLEAGQRAMLGKFRTMTDSEFEALPYGSEGLWRKFMHNCRSQASLEDILTATKSKRYTRSRLDRMAMCGFLGITQQMLQQSIAYVRVLACNDRGREILRSVKKSGFFRNPGEALDHPHWALEQQVQNLYDLFTLDAIPPAGAEQKRRICYLPQQKTFP